MPALILIAYLSLFTLGLIDNIRGPFFPDVLNDLALNSTRGSWFFALTSLVAIGGSFTAPALAARFGSVRALSLAGVVFASGLVAMSTAGSFSMLLLGCAVLGLGFGILNVLQNVLVTENSDGIARRRYLNGLHAMYGISALLAPLWANLMRTQGEDWRRAFLLLALLPILVSLGSWHLAKPKSKAQGHVDVSQAPRNRKKVFIFAAILSLYLWGELSLSTRMVAWLRADHQFSAQRADFYLAIFFAGLLMGRILLSALPLARFSNRTLLIGSALTSAALYAMGLWWTPEALLFSGLAMAPFFPLVMDEATRVMGGSSALGWVIGLGNLSLVLMHLTLGLLADFHGMTAALSVGVIALIAAGGVIIPVLLPFDSTRPRSLS